MNFAQEKRKFKRKQILTTLRLLKISRINFHLISLLNSLDGAILKLLVIVLGFQYDLEIKLREVSYDNTYLERAELIKYQIDLTLRTIER